MPGAREKCTLFDINIRSANISPQELRAGLIDLAGKVYSQKFTDERRRNFFRRRVAIAHA